MIPILNYADRQALQERLLSRSQLTDETVTQRVKDIVRDVRARRRGAV